MLRQLIAAIAPCAVAAQFFAVAAMPLRRRHPDWGESIGALAVGFGAFTGLIAVLGWPLFPARDAAQWLVYACGLFMVLCATESRWSKNAPLRVAVRSIVFGLALAIVLRPLITHAWQFAETLVWLAVLVCGGDAIGESYAALVRRDPRARAATLALLTMAGGSVVMLLSGSAKLALLAGAVTSALFGAAVLAWFAPQRYPLSGALALAWLLTALIWIEGYFYAQSLPAPIALLAASTTTPWLAHLNMRRNSVVRNLFAGIATGALVALAIGIAYRDYTFSDAGYG